jgi:hypothetical protein
MFQSPIEYHTAMVTGASSGLGKALVDGLVQRGITRLILVARRADALEAVAQSLDVDVVTVVADLATDEGIVTASSHLTDVDLLINNAGAGAFGPFETLDAEDQAGLVFLNCIAPLRLTSAALPRMRRMGRGCILNVASGMAFTAMPYMATYAASKAFLVRWTEGLAAELRGTQVQVRAVCPGTFHSNFADNAGLKVTDIPGSALVTYPIEAVAQATLRSIDCSGPVVVPGFINRFAAFANKFVPKRWLARALSLVMARAYRRLSD